MGVKFSVFNGMTRQNKINALINIRQSEMKEKSDYYLALHAMLDDDMQIVMAAKMAASNFSKQSWYIDFGKIGSSELKKKIADYFSESIGFGPVLNKIPDMVPSLLAQNLQKRQKRFEMMQEWDGPFPTTARILNTLREDTQQLIQNSLRKDEKIEKCWVCLYNEGLQPFRDCQRSLDSNAATTLVNLSRILNPGQISPALEQMFSKTDRPIYLLAILTSKRCLLFLRDELRTSQAAILGFNLQQVQSAQTVNEAGTVSVEIETPQDIFRLPHMFAEDAHEASNLIRERTIEAIEAQEEFIDRDFEKELKKLDMLFKARAVKNSEYIFRKSRLQKMELEKFSDANIELLLAKRFSEEGKADKFDEQLMKKFTSEKTVMFTDIVGFSSKASQKQLLDTMTLLAVHDKLLVPIFKKYDGTLIKKIGDALMIRFDEAMKACNAAREMQAELFAFNKRSKEKIFIRIGINTGTVFVKNEDVFGEAVNIAARMETLAKPGRIFITEATMEKLSGRIPCADMGFHQVKGKNEPLHVYAIKDSASSDEMAEMAAQCMQEAGIKESAPTAEPAATMPTQPSPTHTVTSPEAPAITPLPPLESVPSPAVSTREPSKEPDRPTSSDVFPDLTGLLPADMIADRQKPSMPPLPPAWVENDEQNKTAPSPFPDIPAAKVDPHQQMLQSIDQARASYIASVKQGSKRNPDLEDWFARFEEFLRPQFEK